jgi:hypothetical protein
VVKRHGCAGLDTKILVDGLLFIVRLKDLSCTGLCGITDAPLSPGRTVCLLFERWDPVAAEVRWIRKSLIGLSFNEPLPAEQIARLKRNLVKRRK